MKPVLREATPQDVDLLYHWANEPTVRQNAFHTEVIPYDTHCTWFAKILADKDVLIYILHDADCGEDIGQIRLAIEERTALISYSMDASVRGRGLGTRMVLMAEEKLQNDRTDVIYCKAQVKHENRASARVFEKCGYDRQETAQYTEFIKRIRS